MFGFRPDTQEQLEYNPLVDQRSLDQLLASLPLGPLRYFNQTGSSNEEALRWAAAGAPDLSLVVADEQTDGRGRLGRRWLTPPGAALAFSLVLRLEPALQSPPAALTALGALAVSDALQALYGLVVQIKWPNDVLAGGLKLAGVLAETSWLGDQLDYAILGIGINVALTSMPVEADLLYPATCVEAALGRPVERWELLRSVLQALLGWRSRLASPELLQAWEARLAFRGEWVQVMDFRDQETAAGETPRLEGVLLGLEPDGSLRLRLPSGEELAIQTGDLSLRPLNRSFS